MSDIILYDSKNKPVRLSDKNYLTSGGEGNIYFENGIIYKVYNDQKYQKLQSKIDALQKVTAHNIAKPVDKLFTKDGVFSGIILPYVEGELLCRTFANHWRNTNNFGLKESLKLIDGMRSTTSEVHQLDIVMVDANETNWIVKDAIATAIDVDSWQTKDYPAIAVMPSIRDYNTKAFTKDTDWFSFGVVTFQLLTGIHPYKGTHPNYGKGSLEQRMRDRVSVFDSAIKLPSATRSFKDIPQKLLTWYEQTFNSAVRTVPPSVTASSVNQNAVTAHYQAVSNQLIKISKVYELSDSIISVSNGFVLSKDRVWDSYAKNVITGLSNTDITAIQAKTAAIIRFATARLYVKLESKDNRLLVKNIENGETTNVDIVADSLWVASNRLFATTQATNGLLEIAFRSIQEKITAISAQRWPVQILSSRLFRNVIVQDCLGSAWLSITVKDGFLSAPAPELKGYTIIDGFGVDPSNIWISAIRRTTGDNVRLHFSYSINKFILVRSELVDELDIDAAINSSGVGVLRDTDDLLAVKGNGSKLIAGAKLDSHLKLFSTREGIGAYQGKQVFNITLVS
jgi:serine/threonine protein kinase